MREDLEREPAQGMGCRVVLWLILFGFATAAVIFVAGTYFWGDIGSYYLFLFIFFILIGFFILYYIKVKKEEQN
jgi:hypothetical protein